MKSIKEIISDSKISYYNNKLKNYYIAIHLERIIYISYNLTKEEQSNINKLIKWLNKMFRVPSKYQITNINEWLFIENSNIEKSFIEIQIPLYQLIDTSV